MKTRLLKLRLGAKKVIFFAVLVALLPFSCDKENKNLNIFTVADDIQFGRDFDAQIRTSGEYVILDENQYAEAYRIIRLYKDKLLATGKVAYADKFDWKVRIIKDDNTVNAFAVPGGYLYFYTGLIRVLDNEAEFVGVMAHEMGHVACRHSTKQLTEAYGIELMLSLLLGNSDNQWAEIAAGLAGGLVSLKFSRNDEYEADRCAVTYTYPTEWDARGVADFFERMGSQTTTPVFLSTHPADKDRVKKVNETWEKLGGKTTGKLNKTEYEHFKAVLR
jgi:predicted Zn-dependent protease